MISDKTELETKIKELMNIRSYDDALYYIDILLKENLNDNEIAREYNNKAICLMNLERKDEALQYFISSWLKDDFYADHKLFDKLFFKVYGVKVKKGFWLFLYNDYKKNNNKSRTSRYYKLFLKNNRDIDLDELSAAVDFEISLNFDEDESDAKTTKNIISKEDFEKYMQLAEECISKKDYKKAIFYLNKISTNSSALDKRNNMIILEAVEKYPIQYNFDEFRRIITNLNNVIENNDEALLIQAFYLLNINYLERSKECYDEYLNKHEKDKRAIFGKICVLNELGEHDEALNYINSVPAKHRPYLESEILMVTGKTKKAIEILDSILKKNAKDIDVILRKARTYYFDFKFNKSLKELDKILKIDSKNIDTILLKGEILTGLHKYDLAIDTFNKIPSETLSQGHEKLIKYIKNYNGRYSGFYGVFEHGSDWEYSYVENNIFKRIKSQYLDELEIKVMKRGLVWKGMGNKQRLKTISKNEFKHCLKEELLYNLNKNNDYNGALEINESTINKFDEYLKSNPDNYKVLNNKGYVLIMLKKTNDAIECFEKALKINNDDYYAWFNKGVAYLKQKNYCAAKECILKYIDLNDNITASFKEKLANYFYELGWSLYERENYLDSIYCYDISIECNPKLADYFNCKAISLQSLERFDDALNNYSKAIDINPYDEVLNKNKIKCYEYKIENLTFGDDINIAIDWCNDAISDFPNEVIFYQYKCLNLMTIERFDEALEVFDTSLNKFPDNSSLYLNKADCLICMERFDEALELLDNSINKFPNDSSLHIFKACSLAQMELFDEALVVFDTSLNKFPDNAYLYFHKANCLVDMGRVDEALEIYDMAIKIEPTNEFFIEKKEECLKNKN